MKIAILGASGGTGQLLVNQALKLGHEVLALVRNPQKLNITHDNIKTEKVDVLSHESLYRHFEGCEVVMSCLGVHGFFTAVTLYSESVKAIVEAMRKAHVTRLICISSWYTKDDPRHPFAIRRIIKPLLFGRPFDDASRMEDYITEQIEDINYTVVRPPALNNKAMDGREFETVEDTFVPNGNTALPRADVARFMLGCLESSEWDRRIIAIALKS